MSDRREEDNPKQTRRRAVRLRQEALDELKTALTETWNASPTAGKFTREEKASLLGVSRATAERILKREGVDRPSLALAFKNVGLSWDDSYCERPIDSDPVSLEPPLGPEVLQVLEEPERAPAGVRWGFAIAVLCVLTVFGVISSQAQPNEASWRAVASNHRKLAGEAYHRGDFNLARAEIAKSVELATANDNASSLAECRRVAGDLALVSGDLNAAREHFGFALEIRKQLHQPNMWPALWEALGNVEIHAKNLRMARKYMLLSLNGYTDRRELGGIAMACRGLGTVAHLSGSKEEAHQWFDKALAALDGLDQEDMVTDIRARVALLYRDEGRIQEASKSLQTCLDYWNARGHDRWVATTQFQLATVDWQLGDQSQAISLLLESKSTFSRLGDRIGVQDCDQWLSKASRLQPVSQAGS